jgi:hypothetical protein
VDKTNVGDSEPISCEEFRDHSMIIAGKKVWNWLINDIRLCNSNIATSNITRNSTGLRADP